MERITFKPDLKKKFDESHKKTSIEYKHPFRLDVKITIAPYDKNPVGWRMELAGHKELVKACKSEIYPHTTEYLTRRLRKPLKDIRFEDILELTDAKRVRGIQQL